MRFVSQLVTLLLLSVQKAPTEGVGTADKDKPVGLRQGWGSLSLRNMSFKGAVSTPA